jgi:hypothetical protein
MEVNVGVSDPPPHTHYSGIPPGVVDILKQIRAKPLMNLVIYGFTYPIFKLDVICIITVVEPAFCAVISV